MRITREQDDALDFVSAVERLADGLLRRDKPQSIVVTKIDNWFGSRWFAFSGKVMGAFGLQSRHTLTVPPFVPNRVVCQRRFAAPLYDEVDGGKPLHLQIPSSVAMTRKVADIAPGAILLWYSGRSESSGRGSIMAYGPAEEGAYWSWYAGWASGKPWKVVETIGVKPQDLLLLMDPASTVSGMVLRRS
jgi:hypothetical protein